jgi:hypothetical protein
MDLILVSEDLSIIVKVTTIKVAVIIETYFQFAHESDKWPLI